MVRLRRIISAVLACAFLTLSVSAQEKGPLTPKPKREVKRIPVEATPEPPPIPVEEIIKRFTENDAELVRIRNASTYRVSVRLQEYDQKDEPAGELRLVKEIGFAADGKPIEKVVEAPPSTLKRIRLEPEDVDDLAGLPPFMLPASQLANYDVTYSGIQPVDELNTYAFKIRPKQLSRTKRFFEGVIWVDDRDFTIVRTYGQFVSEVDDDSVLLPFKLIETFREYVAEKYWLPSFLRSEETIHWKEGPAEASARVRLTIRYTDYKPPAPKAENGK
jgi:hypothetical protein